MGNHACELNYLNEDGHQFTADQTYTPTLDPHPRAEPWVEVSAKSRSSDDIVVERAARGWALVHITWKGVAVAPPWPRRTSPG